MVKFYICFLIFAISILITTVPAFAVSDPTANPVNKFGINILSPDSEIEEAAKLVNNNGDWGWVVVVVKKTEKNVDRWQSFLNQANKNHIIPIFRLTTEFDSKGYWQKPTDEDAESWADFLNKLYWPTKNRYIQIYNEVNRSSEWGGNVDASDYAKELNKTIDALKAKSEDFFVLNAPLDLALGSSVSSIESAVFLQTMESQVPGIFQKLDGWASHSYPNPDFSASPIKSGRTGINGYIWELSQIEKFTDKNLPVFITETGWKRQTNFSSGLNEETISKYFKTAFSEVWNDDQVVSVSPFVFNYPQPLFYAFAFKSSQPEKEFYDYYYAIRDLPKIMGNPQKDDIAKIQEEDRLHEIIPNTPGKLNFRIINIGNHLWETNNKLTLDLKSDDLEFGETSWDHNEIFPGQAVTATVNIKAKKEGRLPLVLKVKNNNQVLDSKEFQIESASYFSIILNTLTLLLNSFGKSS